MAHTSGRVTGGYNYADEIALEERDWILRRRNNWNNSTYDTINANEEALLEGEDIPLFERSGPRPNISYDTINATEESLLGGEELPLFESTGTATIDAGAAGGEFIAAAGESTVAGVLPSVGGVSATPALTLGTGIIGAAIIGSVANKIYSSGIQVPGTNYVGPGNPIDNGAPTSQVDEDAREHDISYNHINTDIGASDTHTSNKFSDHIAEDPLNIPAIIGHTGLEVKKTIEKHTGQLYPKQSK